MLQHFDQIIECKPQQGDLDKGREDQRRVELRGGELDDVAEAG